MNMSPFLAAEEEQARLAQLAAGPWRQAGEAAFHQLAPPALPVLTASWLKAGRHPVEASSLAHTATPALPESLLRTWLQPPWEAQESEPAQWAFRHSLAQALEDLQLQELALENGYLTLGAVAETLRYRLHLLFQSPAVRHYTLDYGYWSLWRLAQRVGLGQELAALPLAGGEVVAQLPPPGTDATGQVRFASFLSQYRQWGEDPNINLFLKMNDQAAFDTAQEPVQPSAVLAFLWQGYSPFLASAEAPFPAAEGKKAATPARKQLLAFRATCGLVHFVQRLESMQTLFAGSDPVGLATFFAYRLGTFFGYRVQGQQAVRHTTNWAQVTVPPRLLFYITTGLVVEEGEAAAVAPLAQLAARYQEQVLALSDLWIIAHQVLALHLVETTA